MHDYDKHYSTLAARLKALRLKSGYSIAKYALEIDYAPTYTGYVEKGVNVPSIKFVGNIAKFLDISLDILLFGNDDEFNQMLKVVEVYEPIKQKRAKKTSSGASVAKKSGGKSTRKLNTNLLF